MESDVQRRAGIAEIRGDIMTMKDNDSRWVPCPICGNRSRTKVYADTVLVNFPLYCPKCKKESGDFYWKITDPTLIDMIPDGGETSVIHTESYATALTDMGKALTDYMTEQQVTLVFLDGTALRLSSGESTQYDSESKCYKSWFNIFSEAEDQGADVIYKTPDHLLIGGTEYKLTSIGD